MFRMTLRPGRALGAVLALGALTAAGTLVSVQAQEVRPRVRVERDGCRCVDRDGNEIENCTCFRSPDVSGILARALPLRESRARLGITITEDKDAADASQGARIQSVLEDGPADEAGLQEDDIITALDGQSLLRPLDPESERDFDLDGSIAVQRLMALIRDVKPGQEVRLDYLREGESRSTTVTAKQLDDWSVRMVLPRWRSELRVPDAPRAPGAPGGILRMRSPDFFFGASGECPGDRAGGRTLTSFSTRCVGGVALEELNPRLGEYFGTSRGVLVIDVGDDSTLGLEPGDVILDVGGREATDADRVLRILGSYDDGETITIRIMRQKSEMSVQGNLSR